MKSGILYIFVFIPFLALAQPEVKTVSVLAVYACDSNDHYPFPSDSMRQSLYERLSGFYKIMSYGQHIIRVREAINDDGFFVSKHPASYYKKRYDKARHDHGFAMFNEEILEQVRRKFGNKVFAETDIIIMFGTDGGRDWYINRVNATGYGALGVTFGAAQKTFHRRPGSGGFTVELGSDYGTPEPEDDQFLSLQQIHWTLAHEYGHWLGLRHRPKRLGIYSLLTPELYGNARMPDYGPPPLDIFEIIKLGWLNENDGIRVKILNKPFAKRLVGLMEIRNTKGLVLLKIDMPGAKEKIYVSYHNQSNLYDGVYPGRGLLIWRKGRVPFLIRAGSTQSNKKSVKIARQDLTGKSTDFWGSVETDVFSYDLTPARRGRQTPIRPEPYHIEIDNIQLSTEKVLFRLSIAAGK